MDFEDEVQGKSIGRALAESRSIKELDISSVVFDHPKSFYDVCSAILSENCKIEIFKLRGINITQLEAKIIQYILMKNKTLSTLDISHCRADDHENFELFFSKLDKFCDIRFLTLEDMKPDISQTIEVIGQALAKNTSLEVLVLRDNKIKMAQYASFWRAFQPNKQLQKINLQKTEMSDKVVESMA